jgi:hypothetical protein
VTEDDDVLLGRAEMERAFTALGERLQRRGVVAKNYRFCRIAGVGGAHGHAVMRIITRNIGTPWAGRGNPAVRIVA